MALRTGDTLRELGRVEQELGDTKESLVNLQKAIDLCRESLKTDPNRFNGLYGAARAAELAHDAQKANGYYAQLLKNCGTSGSERPAGRGSASTRRPGPPRRR